MPTRRSGRPPKDPPHSLASSRQRPWRSAAYWIILYGFLSLLFIEDYQTRGGTAQNKLAFPHQSLFKNRYHRLACLQANLVVTLAQLRYLHPKCLSLVDIKLASTFSFVNFSSLSYLFPLLVNQ